MVDILKGILSEMVSNPNFSLNTERRKEIALKLSVHSINIYSNYNTHNVLRISLTPSTRIIFLYHYEKNVLILTSKPLIENDEKKESVKVKNYLKENVAYGKYILIKKYDLNSNYEWDEVINDYNQLMIDIKNLIRDTQLTNDNLFPYDIFTLNNYVLDALLSQRAKDSTLKFILNYSTAHYKSQEGYWFLGNYERIFIPFWKSKVNTLKQHGIYLEITVFGDVGLVFDAGGSENNVKFFQQLSSIIPNCERLKNKGKVMDIWVKDYSFKNPNKEIIELIDEFIQTDKKTIDLFIDLNKKANNEIIEDIGFLDKHEFELQLEYILKLRSQMNIVSKLPNFSEKESDYGKLQLEYLKLINIGHFNHVYVEGLSRKVICFIGENGIGKSTLLRAIAIGLIGVDQTSFVDTQHYKLRHLLRIQKEKSSKILYSDRGEIEVGYKIDKLYKNIIELRNTGLNGVVFTDEPNGDFKVTDHLGFLRQLIIGFPQSQGKFNREYQSVSKETDASLNSNIGDLLPLIYDSMDDRLERFSNWLIKTYSKALQEKEENNWKDTSTGKIIQKVFEIISDLVEGDVDFLTVDLDTNNVWITTKEAPDGIILDLISQGFKKVFGWIGYFTMRLSEANPKVGDFSKAYALVLIDEIATYLHPKWQLKILRVLVDNFPNTQFVISTHSPLVLSSLKEKEVSIYKVQQVEEQVVVVKQKYNTYGADMNNILNRVMDTAERPQIIKDKLNELFKFIQDGQIKEAKNLLNKLRKEMDNSDTELERSQMLIETWELINK